MTTTGHTNQAAERAFWLHRCKSDRSLLEVEAGAECNWCGEADSNVTGGVEASEPVASRPDHPPKNDPAGAAVSGPVRASQRG